MKSGVFYKGYLKQKGADKMDVDGDNDDDDDEEEVAPPGITDEKEQDEESMNEAVTDDFVAVINGKVECGQNDEEEESTQSGDSGDAPDEVEGGGHQYGTPIVEEREDFDFVEIYGDDDDDDEDDDVMDIE